MSLANMFSEVCRISTISASLALSQFFQQKITVNVKNIPINNINDMKKLFIAQDVVMNLNIPVKGRLIDECVLLYSYKDALAICDILFHKRIGISKIIAIREMSALTEVVNVVTGNFLTTFSEYLKIDFLLHGAITCHCGPYSAQSKKILHILLPKQKINILEINFEYDAINIKGYLIVIYDEERLRKTLQQASIIYDYS